MKKDKRYYLIVSSSDIYIKSNKNDVLVINHGMVEDIFNNYNIPKEYRKVIIKLSLKNSMAKELLSNSVYYMKEPLVKAILGNKGTLTMESNDNIIDTKLSMYDINAVKSFYQNIIDNKLSVEYRKAIKDIYKNHYESKKNNKLRKLKRNEYIH
ncbi:MAG: hypothetical protein IKI04_01855 [Bacilli bacterium]|nr:hypothetical protein [Bacilli bacterium]